MGSPPVSVIVPIYNTARWLPDAIASLQRQDRRDELEIILIDDGSTDESGRLAEAYAEGSATVRYVRQANAGLGAARNHGLRLATGRYVGFLDSDDFYPRRGLDHLLAAAQRHDAKIAVGDMHGVPPRQSPPWRRELVDHPYERLVESIGDAPDLIGNPSPCNKLFAREFVESRHARFTEGMAFEDVLFTIPLMLQSDRTVLTPRLAYLYRQRGDGSSIMDSRSQPAKIMQHLAILEELMSVSRGADARSQRAVERWTAYMQLHYAGRAAESLEDAQFDEFCARMSALFKHVPIDATREYARGVKVALRAVAIYEHDVPGVRHAYSRAALRVSDGKVYAGAADLDRYRPLLELTPATAEFTGLRTVERGLELRVRCSVPQLRVTDGEQRPDLRVEVGQSSLTLTGAADRTSDLQLRCTVDPGEYRVGRHPVRFAVHDQGAAVPGAGRLPARTRPVSLPDGRVARLTRGDGGVQLVIASRRSLAAIVGGTVGGPLERGGAAARRRLRGLARRAVRYARRLRLRYFG